MIARKYLAAKRAGGRSRMAQAMAAFHVAHANTRKGLRQVQTTKPDRIEFHDDAGITRVAVGYFPDDDKWGVRVRRNDGSVATTAATEDFTHAA